MDWRSRGGRLARLALMYCIRYVPVPWRFKEWCITRATPATVVIGTAIIPDARGAVLLLRARYSGRWILPGGAVHPGEDPRTGAERECWEELGQHLTLSGPTGLYALPRTRLLFVVYRGPALRRPSRLSVEHDRWRYVAIEALPARFKRMAIEALSPTEER